MTEQYVPATEEVRARMVESIAGGTISVPGGYGDLARDDAENIVDAILSELAARDAEVAAKAWALCDATITEHLVGNTAITAAIASGWPENPYRKAVES